MNHKEFIHRLDDASVVAAIANAEEGTSGEIRVFVSSRTLGKDDIMARAVARFHRLGMAVTKDRNGVLLYFVPRERKFAVVGDKGIHEKCGADFWERIAAGLGEGLARGDFTGAVIAAVTSTGEVLAKHFPRRDNDINELTNEISRD